MFCTLSRLSAGMVGAYRHKVRTTTGKHKRKIILKTFKSVGTYVLAASDGRDRYYDALQQKGGQNAKWNQKPTLDA